MRDETALLMLMAWVAIAGIVLGYAVGTPCMGGG